MPGTHFELRVLSAHRDTGGKILVIKPALDIALREAFANPELDPPSDSGLPGFSLLGHPELIQTEDSTRLGFYKLPPHVNDYALLDHGARILGEAGHSVEYDFSK